MTCSISACKPAHAPAAIALAGPARTRRSSPRARGRRRATRILGVLAFTAWAAAGCDDAAAPSAGGTVHVRFEHQVAGAPLVLQSMRYTNAVGLNYNVFELRYYLSGISLESSDGTRVPGPAVFYRDHADATTAQAAVEHVPSGHYSVLHFHFGLRPAENVPGYLPDTLPNLLMQWPDVLGGGYHFMQLDGRYDNMGADLGWMAHLGRLNRPVDLSPVDPSFDVAVPVSVHVENDRWTLPVVMDVNRWFDDPLYDFRTVGENNMSNPDALLALQANGTDVFHAGDATREP